MKGKTYIIDENGRYYDKISPQQKAEFERQYKRGVWLLRAWGASNMLTGIVSYKSVSASVIIEILLLIICRISAKAVECNENKIVVFCLCMYILGITAAGLIWFFSNI